MSVHIVYSPSQANKVKRWHLVIQSFWIWLCVCIKLHSQPKNIILNWLKLNFWCLHCSLNRYIIRTKWAAWVATPNHRVHLLYVTGTFDYYIPILMMRWPFFSLSLFLWVSSSSAKLWKTFHCLVQKKNIWNGNAVNYYSQAIWNICQRNNRLLNKLYYPYDLRNCSKRKIHETSEWSDNKTKAHRFWYLQGKKRRPFYICRLLFFIINCVRLNIVRFIHGVKFCACVEYRFRLVVESSNIS